jgi:thiol-disulfide isomerase/thioredoxin
MFGLLVLSLLLLSHPFSVVINKQNVFEIIGKQNHVIVHFWADGCRHCMAFAPHWNDFVRMYHPVNGIVTATIHCDRFASLCTAFDGSGTPAVQYFAPRERKGALYGGAKEIVPLVKWVRDLTSLDPYTSPGSLLFAPPNEVSDLSNEGGWALIVVDNPRNQFYNHTELRTLESRPELPLRAISNVDYEKDVPRYCGQKGVNCITLTNGKESFVYDGEIEPGAILAFIDAHVGPEL